jgi:hypothetical protein
LYTTATGKPSHACLRWNRSGPSTIATPLSYPAQTWSYSDWSRSVTVTGRR